VGTRIAPGPITDHANAGKHVSAPFVASCLRVS